MGMGARQEESGVYYSLFCMFTIIVGLLSMLHFLKYLKLFLIRFPNFEFYCLCLKSIVRRNVRCLKFTSAYSANLV